MSTSDGLPSVESFWVLAQEEQTIPPEAAENDKFSAAPHSVQLSRFGACPWWLQNFNSAQKINEGSFPYSSAKSSSSSKSSKRPG